MIRNDPRGLPRNLLVGNRIPYEFFICSGSGESDITVHAGSFHLALCFNSYIFPVIEDRTQ